MSSSSLDLAGVEHDPDWGSEGLGWKISGEFGLNRSAITMMTGDLSPDGSVLRICLQRLGFVNISNSLTQVKLGVFLSAYSLNLED